MTFLSAGRPIALRVAAALALLAGLASVAVAQSQTRERVIRGSNLYVTRGIHAGEAVRQTAGGGLYARMVSADLQGTEVQLLPVVPPQGPWSEENVAQVLDREDAWSVLVLDPPRGDGDDPFPRGPLFAAGALHVWPGARGEGDLVLRGTAEGTLALEVLGDAGEGAVVLGDGMRIPLSSVNGPYVEGTVAVYTGAFDGRSAAGRTWPEGTQTLALRPAAHNRRPAAALWDRTLSDDERTWTPRSPRALEELRLPAGEWAIVVPPSLEQAQRTALKGARSVRVEIDLPRTMALSTFTVPVGPRFMRAGSAEAHDAPPETMRAVVALDETGRRAWIAESGGEGRGEFSFEAEELAGVLRREGAQHAAELPHAERYRLLPRRDDRSARVQPRQLAGRSFLLVTTRPQRLFTGDGDPEGLERLAVGYVTGSNATAVSGRPEALFDGQTTGGRSLDHFWAAPLEEGMSLEQRIGRLGDEPLQWAEWRLLETARVEAVDLIHAAEAGFSPAFNLKGFRLLGQAAGGRGGWTLLAEVHHDEPVPRERIRIRDTRPMETMRLEVLEPNFLPAGETARLAEIVLWGRRE